MDSQERISQRVLAVFIYLVEYLLFVNVAYKLFLYDLF